MARRGEHHRMDSEPPPSREDAREGMRARLESVIPDLIKKAVIGGVDRGMEAQETIRSFISESKLPKEIANALLAQIDQTKDGLFRVVAKEIRNFLEAIDWQRELQKLLTTVSFEIKTEIRFIPNDSAPEKLGRPDVKAAMRVKRQGEEERSRRKKRHREREEPRAETEEETETEPTETPPPPAAAPDDPETE
ncbi:MAG: hypothetical protein ACXWUG_06400 [Polyangiales bacterium]